MSFAALLRRMLRASESRVTDRYITLDKSGNASFDLASYLITPKGGRRVEKMASDVREAAENAKDVGEAA